jgi:D-serine deaminase-like pyridoxal phosphate-dependent protein
LAEAEYFAGHGITDILYAVGITPQKLEQVIKLNDAGANVMVITDDADSASVIAAQAKPPRVLIEVDTGEHRGGFGPEDPALLEIAARLGKALAGVMTHAGHSYAGRSDTQMAAIAEAERAGIVRAATRLTEAGFPCPIVSMGSSPTRCMPKSRRRDRSARRRLYVRRPAQRRSAPMA